MPERKRLLEGFKTFRKKYYEDSDWMQQLLKNGTHPDFFVIHCIDPRSGAATVFNTDPGELFGDRVMGALVPPYEEGNDFAASLSYAIKHKKIKHLIILGHTQCGGIEALVNNTNDKDIAGWMSSAQHAFDYAKTIVGIQNKQALCEETEKQAVIMGLKNLMTYPTVKDAFDKGDITLNGWLFDMKNAAIYGYNTAKSSFENLTDPQQGQQQQINSL